jgi:S1-C subfamily serine protease
LPGDTIQKADGKDVKAPGDLFRILATKKKGDSLDLSLIRQGKPVQVTAKF